MANCGCGCTPVRVTMMGGRGPQGPEGPEGPQGEPGEWSAEAQAQAQGFWLISSPTPPTETEMYGVPVVWIDTSPQTQEVPVLPYQPAFRDSTTSVVIPTLVGVIYRVNGSIATGERVFTPPTTITVTAEAAPGYYMTGTYEWTHSFPDPDAIILQTSDAFTGAGGPDIDGRETDNELGGTIVREWENTSTAGAVIAVVDGHATMQLPVAGSGVTLASGFNALPGETNKGLRVEFDLVQGTESNSEFHIAVGGTDEGTGGPGFREIARLSFMSGQTRKYSRDGSTSERAPRVQGQALGTYSIQFFGETARFVIPNQPTYEYTIDDGARGGWVHFRMVNPSSSTAVEGPIFQNLRIYEIG